MKTSMTALLLILTLANAPLALAKGVCKFSDTAKFKDHVTNHIKYPAKGKDVKEACKKDIPDEFTKEEHACVEGKLKDDTEYKNAGEVLKAVGVK